MFSVESHPAKVLFDTGATHSFVTATWVELHNISVEAMMPPMRINSVGGKVQTDKICLNNGGNKEQIFNQILANNPHLKTMQAIQNPKEMVMQLAKQRGIDINQIEELARKLGAK